eukprot:1240593-Pleurochrysis_carterae.AAC.1
MCLPWERRPRACRSLCRIDRVAIKTRGFEAMRRSTGFFALQSSDSAGAGSLGADGFGTYSTRRATVGDCSLVLWVACDEKRGFGAVRAIVIGDGSPGRDAVPYVQYPEDASSRKVPGCRQQASFVYCQARRDLEQVCREYETRAVRVRPALMSCRRTIG